MLRAAPPQRTFLAGFLALGAGCGGDPVERPPIVWTGEHIQVGTDLDLSAWCPGTLPLLDDHVGLLKDLLDAPGDHQITYYLYPPPLGEHACPEPLRACYMEGAVFTTDLFDLHEIAHGISDAHRKMPHFFEEGAASYWGGTAAADFRGLDIRAVLDKQWTGGMGDRGYALAAHFTSYLIHAHGLESYADLARTTARGQSRSAFEETFEQAIGMALDDSIEDYSDQWTYCDTRATQPWFFACAQQPQLVLSPGEWTQIEVDLSCADPAVAGPSTLISSDGVPRIWRDITVDLSSDEQVVGLDVPDQAEPGAVLVEIKRCDSDCREVMRSTRTLSLDEESSLFSFSVTPGRYVARISRAADASGPVQLRWYE